MSTLDSFYVFKLRKNILLDGDLLLAEMELNSLLNENVKGEDDISSVLSRIPELAEIKGVLSLSAHTRKNGISIFTATSPLEILPELVKKLTFVQQIYCITNFTESNSDFIRQAETITGKVFASSCISDRLVIQAIPHFTIFELSSVVAKHCRGAHETKQKLEKMLNALLGKLAEPSALKVVETVLNAQLTSAPLSHDIHYYKAKFFPRMVRSLLNVTTHQLGRKPNQIIDNFAGSGTLLLEASSLGIPSTGIDIDPLSVLISKVKLSTLSLNSLEFEKEVEKIISFLSSNVQLNLLNHYQELDEKEETIQFPSWLTKNRKMTSEIEKQLSDEIVQLRKVIKIFNPEFAELAKVFISDAISRKIRMRILGTGTGRFSLTFAVTSLKGMFLKSLKRYVATIASIEWLQETLKLNFAPANIYTSDARKIPEPSNSFDILITSPPYLPASSGRESYAKARSLSLIGLGLKEGTLVDELINQSIGSMEDSSIDLDSLLESEQRAVNWLLKDKLRAIKAKPTARYFLDIREALFEMYRILSSGGISVVVSGKQNVFYQFSTRELLYVIPTAELIAEEAQGVGFKVIGLYDIKLNKSNRNARPRSLDDYHETLIFLKKPQI